MFLRNLNLLKFKKFSSALFNSCQNFSSACHQEQYTCVQHSCLILGVHVSDSDYHGTSFTLTKTGQKFNEIVDGKLHELITLSPPVPRLGDGKIYYGVHKKFSTVAVVGVGDECLGYNQKEQIDEKKEAIRRAAAVGIRLLECVNRPHVYVESFGHAESAAEGASMASWMHQELRALPNRKFIKRINLFDSCDFTGWKIGLHKAAAQNLARLLQETPNNNLTPSAFAQTATETLSKYGVNVNIRMENWAKLRNLNAFLAVGKGSCEPPVFLEILYEGCAPNVCPIVLIGKGLTFSSGGLCLKTCKEMKHGFGEMAGAAAVVATFRAIAALKLPLNVRGLIPLCANLPGATAFKPGDIVSTHSGKSVRVEDTGCEGLLMHADALSYAREYRPKFILDVGTLTQDTIGAMGSAACGVWSNNESLYETMRLASIHTGDRIWRFPLWNYFDPYISKNLTADLNNKVPCLIGGGADKTAAFLRHFVPPGTDWIHMDNYNIFTTDGEDFPYIRTGMSGRPTRNLIEFLAQLSCHSEAQQKKGDILKS